MHRVGSLDHRRAEGRPIAIAGEGALSNYSYAFAEYTAVYQLLNPFNVVASLGSGDSGEYTFEFSEMSVTSPIEQGFITTSFTVPHEDGPATDAATWRCTLTSCERPDSYGFGSGSYSVPGGFFNPGEGFTFTISGEVSALAMALPEPGTVAMFSLGLLSLIGAMRRRKRRNSVE